MTIKYNRSFIIFLLLFSYNIINANIWKGVVLDEDQIPISKATVCFISLPDSIPIAITVTDKNGEFALASDVTNGLIMVNHVGFEQVETTLSDHVQITLHHKGLTLNEIVINAGEGGMHHKPGMFVYTPNNLDQMAANALRMLDNIPLLKLENNMVSVFGKGQAIIYIDGRKPEMPQSEIWVLLSSLRPNQIKNIEIITAPGSTYKSNDNAIVNVNLRRLDDGMQGNISIQENWEYCGLSTQPVFGLQFQRGRLKTDMGCNLRYAQTNTHNQNYYDYKDLSIVKTNNEYSHGETKASSVWYHISYDINKHSVIGAGLSSGYSDMKGQGHNDISQYFDDFHTTGGINLNSSLKQKYPSFSANLFYVVTTSPMGSILDISGAFQNTASIFNRTNKFWGDAITKIPQSLKNQTSQRGYNINDAYGHIHIWQYEGQHH